jgi:hypothetical protein
MQTFVSFYEEGGRRDWLEIPKHRWLLKSAPKSAVPRAVGVPTKCIDCHLEPEDANWSYHGR